MSIIGILVGFYGYLFPGNINLMVVHLYTTKQYQLLWIVLAFMALFESLYCAGVLYSLQSLHKQSEWYTVVEILSYCMLFLMGIWMVLEKKKSDRGAGNQTLYRGLLSILIHPQQIPFWTVWGVMLKGSLLLGSGTKSLLPFVVFNALGAVLAMLCYMFIGSKFIHYLKINLVQMNKIIGGLYMFLAMYHFVALFFQ